MTVWLVYYHDGFTDSPAELLDICESREAADSVLHWHRPNYNEAFWKKDIHGVSKCQASHWMETRETRK